MLPEFRRHAWSGIFDRNCLPGCFIRGFRRHADAQDSLAVSATGHRLVRVRYQINEDALAQLLVGRDFRKRRGILALHFHLQFRKLVVHGFERPVHHVGNPQTPRLQPHGPREIEEARHERIQPVHFR